MAWKRTREFLIRGCARGFGFLQDILQGVTERDITSAISADAELGTEEVQADMLVVVIRIRLALTIGEAIFRAVANHEVRVCTF